MSCCHGISLTNLSISLSKAGVPEFQALTNPKGDSILAKLPELGVLDSTTNDSLNGYNVTFSPLARASRTLSTGAVSWYVCNAQEREREKERKKDKKKERKKQRKEKMRDRGTERKVE